MASIITPPLVVTAPAATPVNVRPVLSDVDLVNYAEQLNTPQAPALPEMSAVVLENARVAAESHVGQSLKMAARAHGSFGETFGFRLMGDDAVGDAVYGDYFTHSTENLDRYRTVLRELKPFGLQATQSILDYLDGLSRFLKLSFAQGKYQKFVANSHYRALIEIDKNFERLLMLAEAYAKNEDILNTDPDLAELVQDDNAQLAGEIKLLAEDVYAQLKKKYLPEGDVAILEFRTGTVGMALQILSMFGAYAAYGENQKWHLQILDSKPAGDGYTNLTVSVTGRGVYSHLLQEAGVHRIEKFENGSVFTNTVTISVLQESRSDYIEIDEEKDLRYEYTGSTGPGGQNVNKTQTGVRLTHKPSGIVVHITSERSLLHNKATALRILRAKLLEKQAAEELQGLTDVRRAQRGTGSRSQRIRTYDEIKNEVRDDRLPGVRLSLEAYEKGKIDVVLNALEEQQLLLALGEVDFGKTPN